MFSFLSSLASNLFLWIWLLIVIVIWWASRGRRFVRALGLLLLLFIWFLGTRPAVEMALRPLESQYSAPTTLELERKGVNRVVVLTGGGYPVRGEILSSAFPHGSAYRFLAGMELAARLGKDCTLVFSGSAGRSQRDLETAGTMERLSQLVGPQISVKSESRSGSTAEHPSNVKSFVKNGPFLLVTSAVHMPRAVRSFKRAGLNPIPYPVDFLSLGGGYGWGDLIPSVENLWKLNVALREYLALGFYGVIGW